MIQSVIEIPLDKIVCPKQVRERYDEESLDELASSLTECGQLQPIRVRSDGDEFVLLIGGRRVAAARQAGLKTIAAIIEEENLSEVQVLQRQLVENIQRLDFTPIEKANAIDKLMKETGWSGVEVAAKLGLGSSAAVTRLLALLTLPSPIQDQVNDGTIPASAAYELARIQEPDKQAELAAQLASGRLTRDGLSGLKKAAKAPARKDFKATTGRVTAWLDASRSITLSGDGMVTVDSLIDWLEQLLTKARKVRPQGLTLKTFEKVLRDQRNRA